MIKILRMKTGEDIVADIDKEPYGILKVHDPLELIFDTDSRGKTTLKLMYWLPVEIMKDNSTELHEQDVLCMIEPNEEFVEYYKNSTEQMSIAIKDIKDNKETLKEICDADLLTLLDGISTAKIH